MSSQTTSEKHPHLYHYTTFEGFKGIVGKQTLWAKYFKHLNDSSEIFYARYRLEGLLVSTFKKEIKADRSRLKKSDKRIR